MSSVNARILELLKSNSLYTQKGLAAYINKPANTLSTWLTKDRDIPADYIVPICEYFNVSTNYLLLGKETESNIISTLSKKDSELLELYHQLSEYDQGQCVGFIKGLIKREPIEDTVPKKKAAER